MPLSLSSKRRRSVGPDAEERSLNTPAPLTLKSSPTSVSPPEAKNCGLAPVAALLNVTSFTAEATVSRIMSSLAFASAR